MTLPSSSAPTPVSCPSCGSGECSRARMIFELGTATTTSATIGGAGGLGGGHGASFGAMTSGTSQSALAKRCEPPSVSSAAAWVCGVLAAICVLFYFVTEGKVFWLVVGGVFGLMTIGGIAMYREERQKLPGLLAAYDRRWLCLRCGKEWERPNHAEPTS